MSVSSLVASFFAAENMISLKAIEGEGSSKKVNKIPNLSFAETCWKLVFGGLDVAAFLEEENQKANFATLNASSSRHVRRPDF